MSSPAIVVAVTDIETDKTEIAEVPAGDYLIIVTEPCHVEHTQVYANGTHVITVKGRTQR